MFADGDEGEDLATLFPLLVARSVFWSLASLSGSWNFLTKYLLNKGGDM